MIRPILLSAMLVIASPVFADPDAAAPRPVISEIVRADSVIMRSFDGLIEPRDQTDLAFRTGGRLARLSVETGDRVTQGAVLASLDQITLQQDLDAASAAVVSARAAADLAAAQLERGNALLDRGVYSQAQLEQLQTSHDAALAQLNNTIATEVQAREAAHYGNLTAPVDGVVLSTRAEVGTYIAAGSPVLSVSGGAEIEAVIDVPEPLFETLAATVQFEITHQVPGIDPIRATLRSVDPVTEGKLDTRRMRLTLIDPPADYRIGALVLARPLAQQTSTITLLQSALTTLDGQIGVWRVTPDRIAEFAPVTVSTEIGDRITITAGIAIDDEIITRGVSSVTIGQHIGDRIQ